MSTKDAKNPPNLECIVAFVDTLGFDNILQGKPIYGFEIDEKLPVNENAWNFISRFYDKIAEVFPENNLPENLRLTGFSDAVFFVLMLEAGVISDIDQVFEFCLRIQRLLTICIANSIPIRGGISMSYVKAEMFFGKSNLNYAAGIAISEAVKFEGAQEWIGIAFLPPSWILKDQERQLRYCELLDKLHANDPKVVKRWDVPTKKGLAATYAIACLELEATATKMHTIREYYKNKQSAEDCKYRGTLKFLSVLGNRSSVEDEEECERIIAKRDN